MTTSGPVDTGDTDVEPESRSRWSNWRSWRVPSRIYGRVRTTTVFFGLCFVLTGLLYLQVNERVTAQNEQSVQGPLVVDSSELEPNVPQQSVAPSVEPTPTPTVDSTPNPSIPEGPSEDADTTGPSVSDVPSVTPTSPISVPLPPVIASLIPNQPAQPTPR